MSPIIEVQVDGHQFGPGDLVAGTVVVLEGGPSRSVQVLLQFVEETEDYPGQVATGISTGQLHEGVLETGASFRFELRLPARPLPSYQSRNAELYWRVEAKSDEPGFDTIDRRRIIVEC